MYARRRGSLLSISILVVLTLTLTACGPDNGASTTSAKPTETVILPYQGWVTDATGAPLEGNVDMVFRIYSEPTGGTPLWEEKHTASTGSAVPVENGLFYLFLGTVNPIATDLLKDYQRLYLGLTTGSGDEEVARWPLAAVPYAIRAGGSAGEFYTAGSIRSYGDGIFGQPGVGEGGEIVLVEGEEGIRWHMDNAHNTLRWFNKGGEPSPYKAMTLSPEGELDIAGPIQPGGPDHVTAAILQSPDITFETDSSWGRGDGGRALVHEEGDTLILNYDEDFAGGVVVNDFHTGKIVEQGLQTPEEQKAVTLPRFSQGDLLCWEAEGGRLEKCDQFASPLVVAVADQKGKPIVLGAEPVKVLGPVQPGDLLVASDVPGYAVAWSQAGRETPPVGITIAKALEPLDRGQGLVLAMILGR